MLFLFTLLSRRNVPTCNVLRQTDEAKNGANQTDVTQVIKTNQRSFFTTLLESSILKRRLLKFGQRGEGTSKGKAFSFQK